MQPVDQFLQKGLLPFVGRDEEVEQILSLWRGTTDSGRLCGMLLTAEAGSGKSRLLEEAILRVREDGGVVIHAKLYPEATNDLASILFSALQRDPNLRSSETASTATVPEVTALIRRTSRLRRTLLVIEDIHLLPDEARSDLSTLLQGLADETVSLLVAARPVQLGFRGILEPWLISTLEMKGLGRDAIARLWHDLFGTTVSDQGVEILADETLGNPLAIRSALRGAIEAQAILKQRRRSEWQMVSSPDVFRAVVAQSVSTVVEGLLASLSEQARTAAARIAALGEVVAREAADRIAGDPTLISRLEESNVLVRATHLVPPVAAVESRAGGGAASWSFPSSRLPLLAFTHSLVHSRLREESGDVTTDLIALVAENFPLYSLLPLSIPEPEESRDIDAEQLIGALERIRLVVQLLDRTNSWKEGARVWSNSRWLLDALNGRVSDEEHRFQRVRHVIISLSLIGRRSGVSDEWQELLREAESLTADIDDVRFAYARMLFICHLIELEIRSGSAREVLDRAEAMVRRLLDQHPDFVQKPAYVYYLETIGHVATQSGDHEVIAILEPRIDEFLAREDLPPTVRQLAVRRLLKFPLLFFETEEELDRRRALLKRIETEVEETDPYYGLMKVSFLMEIGDYPAAIELGCEVAAVCQEIGTLLNQLNALAVVQISKAAIEYDRREQLEDLAEILADTWPNDREDVIALKMFGWVRDVSLLCGDTQVIAEAGLRLPDEFAGREAEEAVEKIWEQDLKSLHQLPEIDADANLRIRTGTWEIWSDFIRDRPDDPAALIELLKRPQLRHLQLLETAGTIHLGMASGFGAGNRDFVDASVDACERSLRWLEQRRGFGVTPPLIELLEQLGSEQTAAQWRERIEAAVGEASDGLAGVPDLAEVGDPDDTISLSMLGKIRVALPGEENAAVRGIRIRTLLGLMTANEMASTPVTGQDFTLLAGGGDPDPEHARKKKNMGIVRIREIMGRDSVLTDEDYPRLNLELVSVDLIRVHQLLEEADTALSEQSIVRALPLLVEALTILDGEVAFPTLYDDFFDAARANLENRLRSLVLGVARELIAGGESERARNLLRRSIEQMPGDDEIEELLKRS